MSIFGRLMPLEDRLRAVLRRPDQLRQLDAPDRATLARTLRGAADQLDRLSKVEGTYSPVDYLEYVGERAPLAPHLRYVADQLEAKS